MSGPIILQQLDLEVSPKRAINSTPSWTGIILLESFLRFYDLRHSCIKHTGTANARCGCAGGDLDVLGDLLEKVVVSFGKHTSTAGSQSRTKTLSPTSLLILRAAQGCVKPVAVA